ncbi:hypothetical protein [Qipengyuania soli]|uniref:Uncharacterized protein n=1 Tax=Qipengyuania soli TaxID=2782568 RepID=A0A7S8F364_9SPHN|nr:hypothetical protein [Qipengyuania soli]QPC98143.1 hypothetical protein IRL76_09670 [Qipengyuania soli]
MSKSLVWSLILPAMAAIGVGAYGFLFGDEVSAARDGTISSSTEGALDPPELWTCERIYPEYKAYLDAGNAPEAWIHVGKVYRDANSGKIYTWRNWIDWANVSNCGGDALLAKPEMSSSEWLGLAIPQFGVGLVAAERGSGPKSPG